MGRDGTIPKISPGENRSYPPKKSPKHHFLLVKGQELKLPKLDMPISQRLLVSHKKWGAWFCAKGQLPANEFDMSSKTKNLWVCKTPLKIKPSFFWKKKLPNHFNGHQQKLHNPYLGFCLNTVKADTEGFGKRVPFIQMNSIYAHRNFPEV